MKYRSIRLVCGLISMLCMTGCGSGEIRVPILLAQENSIVRNQDTERSVMQKSTNITIKSKPAIPAITNMQQAFNLGIERVNSDGFSVDKVDCKVTIQKSTSGGWLMSVIVLPERIGGEQIVVIQPNGRVIVGPGF